MSRFGFIAKRCKEQRPLDLRNPKEALQYLYSLMTSEAVTLTGRQFALSNTAFSTLDVALNPPTDLKPVSDETSDNTDGKTKVRKIDSK